MDHINDVRVSPAERTPDILEDATIYGVTALTQDPLEDMSMSISW